MSFENRSLVIFGATGGIGAALGRQLAPLGCRLTLAARDQSRLDPLAVELHAEACSVEATDSEAVDRCLAEASERYGRLDGVVNCVGSLFLKPAHATRDEDWANVLATNLTSSFYRWFLSPEQGWVTGQVLAVDGGLSSLQSRMASNP